MDSFLVCMYWTVQVDPIAIVALVFLLCGYCNCGIFCGQKEGGKLYQWFFK